jgi:hypothetical protein
MKQAKSSKVPRHKRKSKRKPSRKSKKSKHELDPFSSDEDSSGDSSDSESDDDDDIEGKSITQASAGKTLQKTETTPSGFTQKYSIVGLAHDIQIGRMDRWPAIRINRVATTSASAPSRLSMTTDEFGNKMITTANTKTNVKITRFEQMLRVVRFLAGSAELLSPEVAMKLRSMLPFLLQSAWSSSDHDLQITIHYFDSHVRFYMRALHKGENLSLEYDADLMAQCIRDVKEIRSSSTPPEKPKTEVEECKSHKRGVPCKMLDRAGNCRMKHVGRYGGQRTRFQPPPQGGIQGQPPYGNNNFPPPPPKI